MAKRELLARVDVESDFEETPLFDRVEEAQGPRIDRTDDLESELLNDRVEDLLRVEQ
jgi:hypothetical protein